ncbi:hypothetical protein DF268_19905 [Streptomyces sp. V2]|nr:hypothetical protein DF268_19905 [Streptomyces sp. V2]
MFCWLGFNRPAGAEVQVMGHDETSWQDVLERACARSARHLGRGRHMVRYAGTGRRVPTGRLDVHRARLQRRFGET